MEVKNLVVAIYSPPEYYPPTLNAIEYLSGNYQGLDILFRNYSGSFDWVYPANVRLIPTGRTISVRDAEKASAFKKIFFFLRYTWRLFNIIRSQKPDTILIYDYIPILSYRMIRPFVKSPRMLWYHNHDVGDGEFLRKWSISWIAWKSEKWIFPKLSIFSLPALERKPFFPMERFNGKFYFLPNFPSCLVYRQFRQIPKDSLKLVKLLYQGSIGPMHGFEEIMSILDSKIDGKDLLLVLKGFISDEYKMELMNLAEKYGVSDKLIFIAPTGYREVIENSMTCHIGIGIHKKQDIMNKTLGTSSNKIYEYAASGLPVLLFDNAHFRAHLGDFKWAFFTDCSGVSLKATLGEILSDYKKFSELAKNDFSVKLNFEKYFKSLCDYLNE